MQIDKIKTIINADLITMRGSKKSNLLLAAVTGCICIFGAFLVSPLVGSYLPLVTGLLIVPLLFQNEQRYHCDKLYCLLPVTRKDVVNARYLFTAALNLVTCLSNFAVTLVSYKFKVYLKVIGDDNDILDKLTAALSSSLSKTGVIVVTCFAMNALSFIMCSSILRNYFKNPESIGVNVSLSKSKKLKKSDYVGLGFTIVIMIIFLSIMTGQISIAPAIAVVAMVIGQLASVGDGFMLCFLLLFISAAETLFQYFCTLIEYTDKEM